MGRVVISHEHRHLQCREKKPATGAQFTSVRSVILTVFRVESRLISAEFALLRQLYPNRFEPSALDLRRLPAFRLVKVGGAHRQSASAGLRLGPRFSTQTKGRLILVSGDGIFKCR